MSPAEDVLLQVRGLKKHFPVRHGLLSRTTDYVRAVDGVTFDVRRGKTLGLVGESGCGKTTIARVLLGLETATGGSALFEGTDLLHLTSQEMRKFRKDIQIIFQDPYSSLNPRMTVGEIVGEPLTVNSISEGAERDRRVQELLQVVGLSRFHTNRYPHEFSGGQRQRIGIARALALNPKLVICDEPVSALDMSIQSQILNLFADLKKDFGLTYMFIAHGLATVKHVSDVVGVMYLGKMVEIAGKREIYRNPLHPYTQALMSAIPIPDPELKRERIIMQGEIPSPINPPSGCRFHTRCRRAQSVCKEVEPEFRNVGIEHFAACHLVDEVSKEE